MNRNLHVGGSERQNVMIPGRSTVFASLIPFGARLRLFCAALVPWNLLQIIAPLLLLLTATLQTANALEAMADEEMGTVTGQEGVMISLDYYYNSVKTDNPATTGAGLSSCTNDGLADPDCRLSWQLANRGQAATAGVNVATIFTLNGTDFDGEWLVWKGGWMSLSVKDLSLDASFLGEAVSAQGATYEGWRDANMEPVYGSFVDSTGACLMSADPSGTYAPCSVNYMKNMPALRTSYPNSSGTYDSGTGTAVGYDDVRFGLEVTGLSAEYDTGVVPGWQLNNFDSFASLKIADNNGNQAGIAFGGNFYLYGF